MAEIIPLHDDPHGEARALMPWYATGQLEAEETARVEAHLAHCADCRAELETERALGHAVADLPLPVERGWAALRARLEVPPAPADQPTASTVVHLPTRRARPMRWLVAAQAAAIIVLAILVAVPRFDQPAPYHVLGSPSVTMPGNVIVMFQPDTAESTMRATLNAAGARLVDGPTAAGAYVLHVTPTRRDAALTALRARGAVTLAQPIDPGAPS